MSSCLSSVLNEFRESSHCSQDSMREDSFVSSTGPDQYSETAIFSCSDSETQGPPTPSQDQPPQSVLSDSELAPTPPEPPSPSEEEEEEEENPVKDSPPDATIVISSAPSEVNLAAATAPPIREPAEDVSTAAHRHVGEAVREFQESESAAHQDTLCSSSVLSRPSSESLSVSMSMDHLCETWRHRKAEKAKEILQILRNSKARLRNPPYP